MLTKRQSLKALAAGAALAGSGMARAQAQADRSAVSVLVGASSSMDFTARLIAEHLRDTLGRPVVAMSKLGAGQRVALLEARKAAPDGRTLVFATTGPFAIYPNIYAKLDYDPDADFTPIAGISKFDVAIATGPMTGATNLKELIAWVKSQAQETVYASAPGNGSLSHFFGISMGLAAGLKMTHVPYKDSGVGVLDLAAGRIPILITGFQSLLQSHKAGRIRIVGISGDNRSAHAPEVPTVREGGVNLSSSTYTGLFGPAKMPADMVERLHAAMTAMLAAPVNKEKLAGQSMDVWPATGPQLAASIKSDRARFAELVKSSGYVPEAS